MTFPLNSIRMEMPRPPSMPSLRTATRPLIFLPVEIEARAVGSAQNVVFSLVVLYTAVAEGMWELSSLFEGGLTPRDMVAMVSQVNLGESGYSQSGTPSCVLKEFNPRR